MMRKREKNLPVASRSPGSVGLPGAPAKPGSEDTRFFQCPACGATVDGQNIESILLHHQHVIHPAGFVSVPARDQAAS